MRPVVLACRWLTLESFDRFRWRIAQIRYHNSSWHRKFSTNQRLESGTELGDTYRGNVAFFEPTEYGGKWPRFLKRIMWLGKSLVGLLLKPGVVEFGFDHRLLKQIGPCHNVRVWQCGFDFKLSIDKVDNLLIAGHNFRSTFDKWKHTIRWHILGIHSTINGEFHLMLAEVGNQRVHISEFGKKNLAIVHRLE